MSLERIATRSIITLTGNQYPGRGIVLGTDQSGENMVQIYWVMGRSENSRNRVLSADGGRVFTQPADPAKVKDPSLIIYNAMRETGRYYVVSNGDQTDKVISGLSAGNTFQGSLRGCRYEPDAPNFTPRITGICNLDLPGQEDSFLGLDIIRKSPWDNSCDRFYYRYDSIERGFGFCIHTYQGNGDPLPAFTGEPLLVSLIDGIDEIAENWWGMLNSDNRVALAVKFISFDGKSQVRIINKYTKV